MKRFEDLAVGDTFESDERTITAEGIVDFAEEYDPQSFHVDENAAEDSLFGGLVASGLHTLCVCNRLATDSAFDEIDIIAGRGIKEIWFPRPVRPGDSLWVQVEVSDKSLSDPHRDSGDVDIEVTGYNHQDEPVVTWTSLTLVAREVGEESGN